MQARRLGEARSALRLLPSTFIRSYVLCDWSSSLLLAVDPRCIAGSIPSHLSLDRSHSFLMSAKMTEPPPIPHKRSKGRKVAPTTMEVMESRLGHLTTLIAATEGRTDLNSKERVRRDKHIWEKDQIEIKIEAHNNAQTFAQAASGSTQHPVAPELNNIPVASSNHPMGLESASSPAAQTNAQGITAIDGSIHKLPTGPSITATSRPCQQPAPQLNPQMTLPLRPNQPRKRERSPIVLPSAASGGIPEPSHMYLSISAMEPQASSMSQPLLLILDLNGTLLYRPSRSTPHYFIQRPSAQQFLDFTLANFSVMIWSSARLENVNHMCNKLFSKESRQRLIAVWGRDRLGLSEADTKKRVQVYKRLEKVWNDPQIQGRHPLAGEGKGWHQGNTILIDDSVEKSRSEPYNFLQVPEFSGHKGEDPNILKEIEEYLMILRMQTNVSSYILRNPLLHKSAFNRPGVTASSATNSEHRPVTQDDSG
jgi:hypothetical protein